VLNWDLITRGTDMFGVDYRTLTSTDATNRYMSLSGTPTSSLDVAVDLVGGTAQGTTDYYVDGTNVKWDMTSYGLYSMLATGDKVRVIYDRS